MGFTSIITSRYNSMYGGRESSTRCSFRKHMQIEKAPATSSSIWQQVLQMLTTQPKNFIVAARLFVLWAFAARVVKLTKLFS